MLSEASSFFSVVSGVSVNMHTTAYGGTAGGTLYV